MAYFLPLPSIKGNPRRVPGIWGEHNLQNSNQLNCRSKTQEQRTNSSSILPQSAQLSLWNSTDALELLSCPWQQCTDTTQFQTLIFCLYIFLYAVNLPFVSTRSQPTQTLQFQTVHVLVQSQELSVSFKKNNEVNPEK